MVRQVEDILRDLGWTEGFHIPVANDENKLLEEKVEQWIKRKGELTIKSEDFTDRVNSLVKYSQIINHQLQQNQAILTAQKRQIDAEDSMYRTAKAEKESFDRELKLINKAFRELGERHFTLQNGIIAHTDKLEKLKATVNFDKDALLSWEEETARGEEDNQLLVKYTAQDESKAKEFELTRVRLNKEVEERNQLLLKIVGDVETLERVLDRTAKMFRQAHSEREDFLQQWEGSARVLRQRDTDIHNKIQEIQAMRVEARHRLEVLREQKEFLKNEINNNKEIELQISLTNRNTTQLRNDYNALLNTVNELTSEVSVMQRTLATTASQLQYKRSRNKTIVLEMGQKTKRIQGLMEAVKNIKIQLENVTDSTISATERAKYLEDMIENEEKTIAIMIHDTSKLNELLYRAQQELFNLKSQEEQHKVDLQGLESAQFLIMNQIKLKEKELERQKEMVYHKEFEAQLIASRLDHYTGATVSFEKKEADERKIVELEGILKEKMETFNLLTTQNHRLEDKMGRLSKELNTDALQLEKLEDKQQNQILLTEGGEKQLKMKKSHNQEKQVEENVLRLRVVQAEKAIAQEGNKVYSLEKQKLELEAAMKERQVEIGVHSDVLTIQKRTLSDEKSHLLADIRACEFKTNQLQKKYDMVMSLLGKTEDGEQFSVTYFKIKSAQEKYQLQQEGDELDAKIRRTEKEILAMENTLKVINATNETYKKNLAAVDEESDEFKEKKELETLYFEAVDTLRDRKAKLNELNSQIQVLEGTLQEIFVTEGELRATWRNKDQDVSDLDRDLKEQAAKLQRAERQLRKISREVKGVSQTKLTALEEKDMETRELQEQNQSVLQQLAELVARHIETGPVVMRYLEEKGLCLPMSRSPGGSMTSMHSRDRRLRTPSVKSPASSRLSLQGSPTSSQLCVPAPSSSHLSVRSQGLASTTSSRSSLRSSQGQTSTNIVTLDSANLNDPKPKTSEKGICSTAASIKRKPKKE